MLANALSSKQMIKFAYAAQKHLHAMLAGPLGDLGKNQAAGSMQPCAPLQS